MNVTGIWEGLTHCEQMSFIHQMGKMFLNTFDLNATQTIEIKTMLWSVFMSMIDNGCWV